jgi:FAD/FMN-containing dehydrogenase
MNSMDFQIAAPVSLAQALRAQIKGEVFTPEDEAYGQARLTWNRSIDQYPAVIVMAKNARDVVQAVRLAHEFDMEVAVQGTGHGVPRPANDCLLIVTSKMKGLSIERESQTAWIEAGVEWGEVLDAAQKVGLAPLLGSSPNVGVVGYTLGGGMGWLARRYGLAADSVLLFEIVTPDGRLVRASQDENEELFWAIRGGGANFGVVTGMQIRLYPVTTVFGGSLIYPIEVAKHVIQRYREWAAILPDEFTTSIIIMRFPPLPSVPEFLQGKAVVMVHGCYCGPLEQGEALMQTWKTLPEPIANTFRAMPFSEVATISNDPLQPMPGASASETFYELSDEMMDVVLRYIASGPSPISMAEFRQGGGAIDKADRKANALDSRFIGFYMHAGGLVPTPEARQAFLAYARKFQQELQPYATGRLYLNFMGVHEAAERSQDAYLSASYDRLRELKAKYDPENRFNHSFNLGG